MGYYMLTLYVLRHGETEWNVVNRIQGSKDAPLTEQGKDDIKNIAPKIADLTLQSVYVSPSLRTQNTVKLLRLSAPFQLDERIREMYLGPFEGLTWEEIKRKDSEAYEAYWYHPQKFQHPSTESFVDVQRRVESFLQHIEKNYQSGNILVITHGVIIKIMQLLLEEKSLIHLWDTPHVKGGTLLRFTMDRNRNKQIK